MTKIVQKGSKKMSEIFAGAAGIRSLIVIFFFVAQGFGTYFGLKVGVEKALAQSEEANETATANTTLTAELHSRVNLIEYKSDETARIDREQTIAIQDIAINVGKIAAKLEVEGN